MDPRRTLVFLALFVPLVASAQSGSASPTDRYQLRSEKTFLGIPLENFDGDAVGPVPFDKPYHELTKQQQGIIRSYFEHLDESDEPPYPLEGLGAMHDPIAKGINQLLVSGVFTAFLEIDAEGNPLAIAVLKSPSKQVTDLIAGVSLLTKFKPALCRGKPCSMGFPIRLEFKVTKR